ncbi:hypothetical protein LTR56_008983 [Elasticomyces elasticus]|nr:hypothetical protein LTR22_024615 [Elasticomyces elasticus]KAK3645796.1 hypothetical protein LTR56_008983 [Elasticomyces elasticus]KAK4924110.1 hypothetical protein LTR49_008850 [Elasticomyces elasticus]KAK5764469.1 hypothetical protein LTS12_005445 [Elasticomyces elasticus]
MAAPRATQLIALRNLTRNGHQQVRRLSMTGPATYASPILTKERPVLNFPRDIAGLRAECKRRRIEPTGSQQDLISRLQAHEMVNSRAFSTAVEQSKRPTADSAATTTSVRHFNTSRSLKSVGDTSTIDFAFLPEPDWDALAEGGEIRVPIIALDFSPAKVEEAEPVVMKAEISTMSLDSVYLPMADSHDGHGLNIDFHAMADKVAANIKSLKVPVEQQAGLMKQIWNDMVDDMMLRKAAKA